MGSFWQWLRIGLVTVFLLVLAWIGVRIGFGAIDNVRTAGQGITTVTRIIYGIASAVVLWGTWRDKWWLRLALYVWGAALIVSGSLAPVVWARAEWATGAFVGVVIFLIALLVGWACEAHTRWYSARHTERVYYYG